MSTMPTIGILIVLLFGFSSSVRAASPSGPEFFEKRIRPVLAENCYECHSGTSKKIKGGLRVDSRDFLLTGGDEGPAIVPGQPEKSRLIAAISHQDKDLAMPPKKPRLPDSVIQDFVAWIREGAPWSEEEHHPDHARGSGFNLEERKQKQAWLWKTPQRPAVPLVTNVLWPSSAIDSFILHRLEQIGLQPAPPADDRIWLRRVYFSITGLPPTRDEIHGFLADRRPEARERVVDQLLASPHFGERWARHWMDLVRYAESRGHEGDYLIANAWQYRDYLIRALNSDVPYNQFLLEHVAGDLIPKARLLPGSDSNESVLGTGWAFLGEENHSPVDIRQDECERIDNKVDVFSKTFLGLTVSCARCHDHKFDPIRAQDYYALSGFMLGSSFRQVRFESMENNRKMAAALSALRAARGPRLAAAIAAARARGIKEIAEYLMEAREVVLSTNRELRIRSSTLDPARLQAWTEHFTAAKTNRNSPLNFFAKMALRRDADDPARFREMLDSNRQTPATNNPIQIRVIADYSRPGLTPWKADGEAFGSRPLSPGDFIFGDDPAQPLLGLMTYGAARRDSFWNQLKTSPGNENDSGRLGATSRAGQMLRTPTVRLETGKLHYLIKGRARVYAEVDSHLMNEGPLHGRLAQTFDSGSGFGPAWVTHDLSPYAGHRVHVEFGPDGASELEVLMVIESPDAPIEMPAVAVDLKGTPASLSDFAQEIQDEALEANKGLEKNSIKESLDVQRHALFANWILQNRELFGNADQADLQVARNDFTAAVNEIATRVRWESRTAIAWFDGTGVDENIFVRGKPFKPGALAPRSLPAAFPGATPITRSDSSGRLELARQMIDPENPLVARVFVNRVWHHLFGRGIVATVDNFGAMGERPTHPELLDYLAWQFVHEDHWSLKRLIRRLVLTQTFAMSSRAADPVAEEKDPSNAWLHRMPVRRLEGEAIRDALLAVSGRLNPAVGGAPEPLYLTEFLVGRGRPEKSGPLDGDGRRSVYMAMHRNFLPAFQSIFDAPTPFSSVGRRNVTNVPGQSLALMNDPLFHQQARVWQERLFHETPGASDATRVAWLFESAYGRLPDDTEAGASIAALAEFRSLHESSENQKIEAWVDLCHALLNATDFIYLN